MAALEAPASISKAVTPAMSETPQTTDKASTRESVLPERNSKVLPEINTK